jgi:phosphoribosylformylglycinamidine synthase subunit PurQ / glutaminase
MIKKVKVIILRAAGTNCDEETARAFAMAGADPELVHVNVLKKNKSVLDSYHILALPGGFTYGDDVASGKILANELRSSLKDTLSKFVSKGKPVIGICNGFQVLVKMGLLPALAGAEKFRVESSLSLNDSGRFLDKWVYLKRVDSEKQRVRCVWTADLPDVVYMPIAHAEGKFIPKDQLTLKKLKDNGQVVFRYTAAPGTDPDSSYNPNGSVDDIAGVCDPSGCVLGMMPHPERHVTYLQHPRWRREEEDRSLMGVGLEIFKNGVKFAENNL